MTTLRKAMPFTLLCAALLVTCLPLAAQNNPDCSFTFHFTGDATQTGQSNLSGNTPCVNWRVTYSTTATLTTQVTFETSPDNATWTAVPNTICSATVQPPCLFQGTNPTAAGAQGMIYASLYGNYVRVITSGSAGAGTGTVRAYGAKGATASAGNVGGGGGGSSNLIFVTVNPAGACTVGTDVNQQNTVTAAQWACVGPPGPNAGTWALIIAANSSPLNFYFTPTASSIATYLQATTLPYNPKTTLSFAALATGTDTLQNWSTNAGSPDLTFIPAGEYIFHIHALRTGGGTVTLHAQFWEVDAAGVDIAMIGQTGNTAPLGTTEIEYITDFADGNVYTLASTASRIVARVFAVVSGSSPTVQIFVGGTADSHIQIPSNSGNTTSLQPGSIDCADATGSTTVYTCPTPSPIPPGYAIGALFSFTPQTTNTTTTPTLNVAGLGAKNLVANTGGAASLTIGQLIGGTTYPFEFDGTSLRLLTSPGATGTVTHTGSLTSNAVILGNGTADVKPGAVLPADATKFYDGTGNFSTPPGASAVPAASNLTPVTVSANTTGDQTLQEVTLTAGALNTVLAANIIHGSGRFTTAVLQTPTLTFKALLCTVSGCGSGTVVTLATITSGATLASSTDHGWNLQLMAGTSVAGATGNLWVHGAPGLTVDIGALPGSAATPYTDTNTTVSANIDLTGVLFVDFTVATSSGDVGNSITQDIAEILPQGAGGGGGSGLLPWMPAVPATPPALSSWTQINPGGTGSFFDARNAVVINGGSGDNLKALWLAAPGAPGSAFTITAHVIGEIETSNFPGYGIWVGDTGTNMVNWLIIGLGNGGNGVIRHSFYYYTSPTAFSSNPFNSTGHYSTDIWLRIVYDGTLFSFQTSPTGTDNTFTIWGSQTAASFLASSPAKIGIVTYSNVNADSQAVLTYWNVTQP